MTTWLVIAGFGAVGCVLRFAVQEWLVGSHAHWFPWATLLVNAIGCLAIGVVWAICEAHAVDRTVRVAVMAGLLGGFTTFSGFALDGLRLMQAGHYATCAVIVVLQNVVGFAAAFVGYRCGAWTGLW